MDFKLTEEQSLIRDSAQRMVERTIQPILDSHDADKSLPKPALLEIYSHLAAQNLTAPRVPEAEGGTGLKLLNFGLVFEQMPPWLAISNIRARSGF